MSLWQALLLGTVQGLTEFLPVSSSGHLVLFQRLLGLESNVLTFDILVHLATLAAVLAVYRKDVVEILKHPLGRLTWLLVLGTIPAVAFGLGLKDIIEYLFRSGKSLGFEFLFTGAILWFADSLKTRDKGVRETKAGDALLIGSAQALAILPAVSRSGFTIAGALWRGLDRKFAAKFSFLLSIPAILGAAVLDAPNAVRMVRETGTLGVPTVPLIAGFIAAAVFGWLAVQWMIRIITTGRLRPFAIYVSVLGILILIEQIFSGHLFGKLF
ncbi:undecaprenyl-diphosphate phosphatase [bacterium]|nr:undecaprenyl-diphosphate phosphatase [bacterium]